MSISLYDATIPSYLQILGSVSGLIDKAEQFCAANGRDPAGVSGACLADDMLPFAYQILSTTTHSIGAIEAVRSGSFSPNMAPPPHGFAEQRGLLRDTIARLEQISADEMEGFAGKPVVFSVPALNIERHYTAVDFLLSFSQPNFYFHASTAYGILRNLGVSIGKRDFMGVTRTVPAP